MEGTGKQQTKRRTSAVAVGDPNVVDKPAHLKNLETETSALCVNVKRRRHGKTQHEDNKIQSVDLSPCRICKHQYESRVALRKHESRCKLKSSEERMLECYVCDICLKYTFKTIQEWNDHRQLHFEDARFTCPRCDKIFTAAAGVENHLPHCRGISARDKKPSPSFTTTGSCPFCKSKCIVSDLSSHVLNVHPESVMFACTCRKLLFGRDLYAEHARLCQQSKILFACEMCDSFVSSTKRELFVHKRTQHPLSEFTRGAVTISGGTTPMPTLPRMHFDYFAKKSPLNETPASATVRINPAPPPASVRRKTTHQKVDSSKLPAASNLTQETKRIFSVCHESYDNKDYKCPKCERTFHRKGTLQIHSVKCDGKFVFKGEEHNISEKDCSFLIVLN